MRRVRTHVAACLRQAVVFGSTARGEARPGSDVDVLLIFRRLPPDREPQASQAEHLARLIASSTSVPVEPWSVSLPDLRRGFRTPMLVDALTDGLPLWPPEEPVPRITFTPDDALYCAGALLDRIREGGQKVGWHLARARDGEAALQVRNDLVRGCVAALLLRGETRPRHAAAIDRFVAVFGPPEPWHPVLLWAARSFGPAGANPHLAVPLPPGGISRAASVVNEIAAGVRAETHRRLWG